MRSTRVRVGLAALCVAALSACGSSTPDPKSSDSPEPTEGKTKIVVWTPENRPADVQAHAELIEAFESANEDIEVEMVVTSWDDHFNRLQAANTAGNAPDIVYTWQPNTISLNAQGMWADVTEVWESAGGKSAFPAGQVSAHSADGKFFGVPFIAYPHGLWYRTDWFADAGLNPPESLDDLLEAARKLTNEDHKGICLFNKGLDAYYVMDLMLTTGGESYDASGDVVINSPATERVLEFIKTVADEELTPAGWTAWNMDDAKLPFLAGECAMKIDSSSFTNALAGDNPDLLKNVSFAPLPLDGGDYAGWAGTGTYGVPASSKNQDAAKRFLSFMFEPENYQNFISQEVLGFAPVLNEVAQGEALYKNERIAPYAAIYKGAAQAAELGSALIGSSDPAASEPSSKAYNQQVYSEMGAKIAQGDSVSSVLAWAETRLAEVAAE